MDLSISEDSIRKTSKCPHSYKCLNGQASRLCRPENSITGYGVFVDSEVAGPCPYKLPFGYGWICKCPVRIEIFERYRQ